MTRTKKYDYVKVPVPLSYNGNDVPSIHRIVDIIHNKELSGWRFFKAKKFKLDKKTGLFRPRIILFRRPKKSALRVIMFNYMTVTVLADNQKPDSGPNWKKVGIIECDIMRRPRVILFRKESHEL